MVRLEWRRYRSGGECRWAKGGGGAPKICGALSGAGIDVAEASEAQEAAGPDTGAGFSTLERSRRGAAHCGVNGARFSQFPFSWWQQPLCAGRSSSAQDRQEPAASTAASTNASEMVRPTRTTTILV